MDLDSREFEAGFDQIPVPEPNLSGVMQRAGSVRRRDLTTRFVAVAACAALVVVGAIAVPRLITEKDHRVIRVPDLQRSNEDDAKAITFAFRALSRTGRYVWDYKGFSRRGDARLVRFDDGLTIEELRAGVEDRRSYIESVPRTVAEFRDKLRAAQARLERAIQDESRTRRGVAQRKQEVKAWRNEIGFARRSLEDAIEQLEERRAALQAALDRGGAHEMVLTVESEGNSFVVAELESDPRTAGLTAARREAIEDFTEAIPRGEWGIEYFEPELKRDSVLVRTFWTGPVPSPAKLECEARFFAPDGTLVYRSAPPAGRLPILGQEAPPNEDRRDGSAVGFSVSRVSDVEVADRDLEVTTSCRRLEGNYEAVGEAFVTQVEPGDTNESTRVELIPGRHVWANTQVRYVGEQVHGETICIARVFDGDGSEVGRHGMTLYHSDAMERTVIQIAVDVGDAALADSATVHCQPTIPGVPLGPDQEEGPN